MPASERRIAFSAKRTVGGAVKRNRACRKLREFYRQNKAIFPDNYHYILLLRNEPSNWNDLEERLRRLLSNLPVVSEATD
ncbi:ribonuclease P protein component [bacterium]|nr:ribonuclease P protein component [bacterium]